MHHFFDAITNNKGDALTGYYVRLVDADSGSAATLYADTSLTPIISDSGVADAAKVDSDGNVSIYVDVGTYHLDIYATDSTTLIRRISNVGMNIDMDTAALAEAAQATATAAATSAANDAVSASESETAAAASAALASNSAATATSAQAGVIAALGGASISPVNLTAATRVALAAIDHTLGIPVMLSENGREGFFVWDSSDLSYQVGMDTRQAVYVPPAADTDGSSGAWVRRYNGPLKIEWFGGVADWNGTTGTDNLAALKAATDFEKLPSLNFSPKIELGLGKYYVSSTLEIETVCHLVGQGGGTDSASVTGLFATMLVWPVDTLCIRIHNSDTHLATTQTGDSTKSAAGTVLENFCISQATQGTSATAYGVWMRSAATLNRLSFYQIASHAIYQRSYSGGAGAERGNTSDWKSINCFVYSCGGDGIHTYGNDANAGYCIGFETKFCGGCGIYDVGSLGNTYIAPQISGYGTYGGTVAGVYHLGHNYQLIASIDYGETLGNTTTPGTASHVWHDLGTAGSATTAFPQWVSGTSYTFRAPIHITGSSNSSMVINPYIEAGATLGHADGPTIVYGGLAGFTTRTPRLTTTQQVGYGAITTPAAIGSYRTSVAGTSERTNYGAYQYTEIGSGNPDDATYPPNLLSHFREKDGGFPFFWGYQANANDHYMWYAGQKRLITFTGPLTAVTFGRSTAQPYQIAFTDFGLMDPADATTARLYGIRSAVPSSGYHAQGEIYWNVAPSLTGVMSWVTTVSGTPGTFAANYINARADASTGIGYVTGAGGAVTQATSRTTGVTLNKVTGAITLVSAAGSATWRAFTVTNSAVAATDTIIVNQKSGTDKYMISVTAVGAGSFEISSATTGGTTTEQPVFNFSVVKAVAA